MQKRLVFKNLGFEVTNEVMVTLLKLGRFSLRGGRGDKSLISQSVFSDKVIIVSLQLRLESA